jgi:hypothetical protein
MELDELVTKIINHIGEGLDTLRDQMNRRFDEEEAGTACLCCRGAGFIKFKV